MWYTDKLHYGRIGVKGALCLVLTAAMPAVCSSPSGQQACPFWIPPRTSLLSASFQSFSPHRVANSARKSEDVQIVTIVHIALGLCAEECTNRLTSMVSHCYLYFNILISTQISKTCSTAQSVSHPKTSRLLQTNHFRFAFNSLSNSTKIPKP